MVRIILSALVLLIGSPVVAEPLVIAHRGASGERPEHTRSAYELAIDQGADFIEPDLVMSKDGHLVVRHENEIGETTDVADHPSFADRRTTRTIDGRDIAGWFTEDFTLAELKTLRARERLPQLRPGNTAYDGQDPILTFQEVVDIAGAGSARSGRVIGVIPEIKHPSYFRSIGVPMEATLVAALIANDLTTVDAPVMVQCFEVEPLKTLNGLTDVRLVQLIAASEGPFDRPDMTYADMVTPSGLAAVADYADVVGVETTLILPRDADNRATTTTTLVANAHAAGLKVSVWTFRAENYFLAEADRRGDEAAPDYLRQAGDLSTMIRAFYDLGVDSVFSDFPGIAVQAHRQNVASN